MKNAHPYTGKWLRECFPEQTKSVKSILVWSVVFLADVTLVFWAAIALGLKLMSLQYQLISVVGMLLLVAALALFWVETEIYNRILARYRKTRE